MIEIKNIYKVFNNKTINEKIALNGINLTINDGDFITVIGGNGAGKSTMLNCIAGSISVSSGNICIDNVDVTHMKEHKRAKLIGRVFQDPMLGTCGDMQIVENLALASSRGHFHGLKFGIRKSEIQKYKEYVSQFELGLENRLTTNVKLLSGGQRQALTLLMATLNKPKLLLLDEHTAALDPKTAKKVLNITDKIVNENKITTLMITHNLNDAITYGNRLIMMSNGKIIFDVSGEQKNKLTASMLMKLFNKTSKTDTLSDRILLNDELSN